MDIKHRAMATLTAVSMRGGEPQVRDLIRMSLNVGLTPEEIVEVILQSALYGGVAASFNGLAAAKEVFEERGIDFAPSQIFDPSIDPDTRYQIGIAKHAELMPNVFGYYSAEPTEEEHELDQLTNQYLWGAIWTRPGLDTKARIVCALAAEVAQGRYDQYVRRMIEGALRNGVSRSEIMEILMHLAFYVGMLPARSAMNIANTVFRSPEFSISGSPGL